MNRIETDVCVIGSGVAGGIVAAECSALGRDVVMLDVGKRVKGRPIAVKLGERLIRDFKIPRMKWHRGSTYRPTDYENAGNQRYALRGLAVNARGGSTLGWIGTAYRMQPEDFRMHSSTGRGMDWPISYESLEPFYALAEQTLRVSGDHRDEGHGPRSGPFPLPARPYHRRDDAFLKLLANHGWPAMHHNIALAPDGGAFTMDQLLDELESRSNVQLITRAMVNRIVSSSRSRVAAVDGVDADTGQPYTVAAQTIVVCAGGIETPNLLARSANEWWPTGLGDHSGHLGRHLFSHVGMAFGGRLTGLRLINGPIGSTVATRYFDSPEEQAFGKYLLLWYPTASGYLFLKVTVEHLPHEANRVTNGTSASHFGMPAPIINFNYGDEALARQNTVRNRLEELAAEMNLDVTHRRQYVNAHPMGTARMSIRPSEGVLDPDLRLHEMENLYVCSSAAFPTGGAANPTPTIAALAHRLGRHLSAEG